MKNVPKLSKYSGADSYNAFPSATKLEMGVLSIWLSYNNVVAFQIGDAPPCVRENIGGAVMGRHLDSIDDGSRGDRLSQDQFADAWDERVAPLFDFGPDKTLFD
jgi:hypothetical protein